MPIDLEITMAIKYVTELLNPETYQAYKEHWDELEYRINVEYRAAMESGEQ